MFLQSSAVICLLVCMNLVLICLLGSIYINILRDGVCAHSGLNAVKPICSRLSAMNQVWMLSLGVFGDSVPFARLSDGRCLRTLARNSRSWLRPSELSCPEMWRVHQVLVLWLLVPGRDGDGLRGGALPVLVSVRFACVRLKRLRRPGRRHKDANVAVLASTTALPHKVLLSSGPQLNSSPRLLVLLLWTFYL